MPLNLVIKLASSGNIAIEVEPSLTILEVKQLIATKCEVPANQQRLIYSGKVLKDPETVESYSVQDGHTVHMVKATHPRFSVAFPPPHCIPLSSIHHFSSTTQVKGPPPRDASAVSAHFFLVLSIFVSPSEKKLIKLS